MAAKTPPSHHTTFFMRLDGWASCGGRVNDTSAHSACTHARTHIRPSEHRTINYAPDSDKHLDHFLHTHAHTSLSYNTVLRFHRTAQITASGFSRSLSLSLSRCLSLAKRLAWISQLYFNLYAPKRSGYTFSANVSVRTYIDKRMNSLQHLRSAVLACVPARACVCVCLCDGCAVGCSGHLFLCRVGRPPLHREHQQTHRTIATCRLDRPLCARARANERGFCCCCAYVRMHKYRPQCPRRRPGCAALAMFVEH